MKINSLKNSYYIIFTKKELKQLEELKEFRGMKTIKQTIRAALKIEIDATLQGLWKVK